MLRTRGKSAPHDRTRPNHLVKGLGPNSIRGNRAQSTLRGGDSSTSPPRAKSKRISSSFLQSGLSGPTSQPPDPSTSTPYPAPIARSRRLTQAELDAIFTQPDLPQTSKLLKQTLVNDLPNVINGTAQLLKQYHFPLRGRWNRDFFQNDNPIVVELGCGYGQYVVGLAKRDHTLTSLSTSHQSSNYIGIEQKGSRLYTGATELLQEGLTDAAFIRGTFDFIALMFGRQEVDELWLTFPDQNFHSNPQRHITSTKYTPLYHQILKTNGVIHLKTDQDLVFDYALKQVRDFGHTIHESHRDLYAYLSSSPDPSTIPTTSYFNPTSALQHTPKDVLAIKTKYEELWSKKGATIKYLKFTLNPNVVYQFRDHEDTSYDEDD